MLQAITSRHWKQVAWCRLGHAIVSALFWLWAGAVALGLGFKDRTSWSAWDHFQAAVVPTAALAITSPGRFFLENGWGWVGLVVPWLINSCLWAVVLVFIWNLVLTKRRAT
jgi:hypothetical protein